MAESMSARSVSLPSRLINPKAPNSEEEPKKLQHHESLPSTSWNVQVGLRQLVDMYDFVNSNLIRSPPNQETLHQHVKYMEAALDESIMLVDACDFTRDLIETLKEHIQDLQSSLRRQGGDYSSIKANFHAYASFRKRSKKHIARHLKSLSRTQTNMKNKSAFAKSAMLDQQAAMVFNIMRQSNAMATSAFRSLLLFLSSSELISARTAKELYQKSSVRSVLGRIIRRRKDAEVIDVQMMLKRLAMLNMSLEAIQEDLGGLSRWLIQLRACLLNILN